VGSGRDSRSFGEMARWRNSGGIGLEAQSFRDELWDRKDAEGLACWFVKVTVDALWGRGSTLDKCSCPLLHALETIAGWKVEVAREASAGAVEAANLVDNEIVSEAKLRETEKNGTYEECSP
jgi:hypothetical protein